MRPGDRILEIGHAPYLRDILPERTRFIAIGAGPAAPRAALAMAGPSALTRIPAFLRMVTAPDLGLIVCRIHHHPGRAWALAMRLLLTARIAAPILVLDFEDEDIIHPAHRPLLDAAELIFKRELPVDRWRLARRHADRSVDEPTLRRSPEARRLVAKLRPLPLGLPLGAEATAMHTAPSPKSADIFFAGEVEASAWSRAEGLAELRRLGAEGVALDMPAQRLPREEFHRRCAAAWLTWSPAGYGWQCFRHSEAAARASVPLIPYPTVACHAGLADGEHAIFCDPRPGGLAEAARRALADRDRLARIGEAARRHVLAHHTPAAIADYILAEAASCLAQPGGPKAQKRMVSAGM